MSKSNNETNDKKIKEKGDLTNNKNKEPNV
jgi:hypothetical protein